MVLSSWFSDPFIKQFEFLTIWGLFITFLTFTFSCYQIFFSYKVDEAEENKNKPFVAWKIHIILFELALVMELVITPFFWLFLWPGIKSTQLEGWHFPNIVCPHFVPLFFLLIDYSYNQIPFIKRHLFIMLFVTVSYLIVNLVCTKVSGIPVYPIMTWDSFGTCMIPVGTAIVSLIIFMLFTKCNQYKIRTDIDILVVIK